jgi:hypothetical protein
MERSDWIELDRLDISGLVKRSLDMLFFKHQNTSFWYVERQSDGGLFPAIVHITTGLVINRLRSCFCTRFFLKSVPLAVASLSPADIFDFRGSPRSG